MTQIRIVDEDGTECPTGEVGEVTALTPYTMTEYHRLPDKSAETVRDGWLYTGDLGESTRTAICISLTERTT